MLCKFVVPRAKNVTKLRFQFRGVMQISKTASKPAMCVSAKQLHQNREGTKKRVPKIRPSYGKNYIDGPHFGAQNPAPFLENVTQHSVALFVALGRKPRSLSSTRKVFLYGLHFSPSYLHIYGTVRKTPHSTRTMGHHSLRAGFGAKSRPPVFPTKTMLFVFCHE